MLYWNSGTFSTRNNNKKTRKALKEQTSAKQFISPILWHTPAGIQGYIRSLLYDQTLLVPRLLKSVNVSNYFSHNQTDKTNAGCHVISISSGNNNNSKSNNKNVSLKIKYVLHNLWLI